MIVPAGQEKINLINSLKELDCCSRCTLRYLGIKDKDVYLNPDFHVNTFFEDGDSKEFTNSQPKRARKNPCRVCLDILQDSTVEKFIDTVVCANINEYKYLDFMVSVSFPKSIFIRNHSIFLYLKQKFPNIYSNLNDLDSLRKIFRIVSGEIISRKTKRYFSPNSNFNINFEIEYEDDDLEIQNIKNINSIDKRNKKYDLSRITIGNILEKCEDTIFKEQFPVPPNIPNKQTKAHINYVAEPMWIGGRYLKFSRNMGQTPWIINDKPVTDHCLQDILFDTVEKVLGSDRTKLTFCASGREDSDVRMLGNGRPFYIQIDDPKERSIPFKKFRDIEMGIFQTKLAAVVKLQEICKSDIKRIKDGEQHKRKHYYALCQVKADVDIMSIIKKINSYNHEVLDIEQKTPLRVLHRRTQAIRQKCIYSLEASPVSGYLDLLEIKVVTQAGTYVKEFINGDFQRTQPSLSSIIQYPIDVVALDVTKIELIWPEEEINIKIIKYTR